MYEDVLSGYQLTKRKISVLCLEPPKLPSQSHVHGHYQAEYRLSCHLRFASSKRLPNAPERQHTLDMLSTCSKRSATISMSNILHALQPLAKNQPHTKIPHQPQAPGGVPAHRHTARDA